MKARDDIYKHSENYLAIEEKKIAAFSGTWVEAMPDFRMASLTRGTQSGGEGREGEHDM